MLADKRKLENDSDASPPRRRTKPFVGPADDAGGEQDSSTVLSELKALLDLSDLTSRDDISSRFDAIADILLNRAVLRLHGPAADEDTAPVSDYEILELEFYLYKPGCHEDPFTHGTEEQRRSGRWYFHRAPRRSAHTAPAAARTPTAAAGYRGGTRKGLDLTFGGPVDGGATSRFFAAAKPAHGPQRGGILLRTLRRRADRALLAGPSLLVDELLRASGAHSIAALVADVWPDLAAFPPAAGPALRLHVAAAPPRALHTVYRSPRIGLDLSHPAVPVPAGARTAPTLAHPRTAFVSRRYRYFVQPAALTANGRGHTFLGVHEALCHGHAARLAEGELVRRLADLTGLKHSTAMKYLDEYRAGRDCSLRQFVGAQGKGSGSSPVPFLRMLGCLDHLQKE